MKSRIEELADFYEQNIDDPRVMFFEKLRIKIKKALHHRPKNQARLPRVNLNAERRQHSNFKFEETKGQNYDDYAYMAQSSNKSPRPNMEEEKNSDMNMNEMQ